MHEFFCGKLSFILFDQSFLFPEQPAHLLVFFNAPACTTTLITLEPCALNAEFLHSIPRI
jgi:hypothetical protein